ncbi:nucleotidyltransferase domain-containing protein [Flavobacterium sp. AS60]|uniref:nucleotidyltransferase domain-containing protein n=1 Tax=Flavobacterium anseongense TaxID=2910677 RepID=UPI001F27213C|nr:nucleotidyltransferase domain-containing protein [Flavobacterium sp. AS60]MCF6128456.1 nucleotidyltransferase domain-containing protein [Flavobacterium sp. AS60]
METLKTILYFSIFRYPLKIEEIHSYTNYVNISETEKELQHLMDEKILIKVDEFYVYGSDLDSVIKRLRGNLHAKKALTKANQRAKLIAKFPYVEAVGISGSLSKDYYDNESDIDFFVITKPNKLWICRTLLMLYKKIFLLNSRKYFCVNYFVSSNQMEIQEKNRFTATELKTLIPIHGKTVFEQFYQSNKWVNDYFSKFEPQIETIQNTKKTSLSRLIEFAFDTKFGTITDSAFKVITLKKWKSKFHYMNEEDFKIALKTTKSVSKHHPSNFQKKVILSLNTKLEEVQSKYNVVLQREHV